MRLVISLNSMFALVNPTGDIQVTKWQSNESCDLLTAHHTGYQRLADPVVHQRSFHLDKIKHQISIEDSFSGKGKYQIDFFFHLDTEITCETEDSKVFFIKNGHHVLSMQTHHAGAELKITSGWVAKAYNQKEPAQILTWGTTIDAAVPRAIQHSFIIENNPNAKSATSKNSWK